MANLVRRWAGVALGLALVTVTPRRLAWLSTGVAAVAVPVVGTATVATGGHRPTDPVGAYLTALAWFSALAAVLHGRAWSPRTPPVQGFVTVSSDAAHEPSSPSRSSDGDPGSAV